ncbi:glucan biosynthesis protein G [Shewanella sp. SG41-3]|uniref:glucan biosynthesis protein G n=1 Tax=Shewanella sp. SG41-3 TaxID=2760977 RepID=UPI001601E7ED|nr:glucan biosynthesis protein G [Shewanella sp. SG41-3]MBB1477019.1 glucan biosynthesis protein G [Shewanella sp. SG41-3]
MLRTLNLFCDSPVKQRIYDQLSVKGFLNLVVFVLLVSWTNLVNAQTTIPKTDGKAFSHDTVVEIARKLSQKPFIEPKQAPEALTKIDYSTYRQINFQQDAAIWGNAPTPFSIQLFAPGYIYKQLVDIDVVENSKSFPVAVSESSFRVPDESIGQLLQQVGKYAGFRLHYPINRDDYKDEFLVFQGASYFRGVSKGQAYGLSTRGLAINVADPKGEEYPLFKKFWIERPSSHQKAIVVHALLDSVSVTGAYRFAIYPGDPTRMGVDVMLFPRRDVQNVGLAPLTSMFMHGGIDRADTADYRPAVHDSEGLLMEKGNREKIWRPLNNPRGLQVSSFMDENPKGFGLMQPHRQVDYYQDLEAKYHQRPSAWVEPTGDWGKGRVELVEIPSDSEANDNIVAYWKPENGLKKDQPFAYSYQLTWVDNIPKTEGKVKVVRTAGGRKLFTDKNEIVIDYSHLSANDVSNISVDASISSGAILEARIEPNPNVDGARVFVTFDPEDADVAELRVQLRNNDKPLGMTWLYRFTSEDWPL